MPPYRILVVDDSAFMRKFISDIITSDQAFTVIGTARDGRDAIEAVKRLRPDAVTMDVEMPEMTGLEALPFLMKEAPTPVIMLSSSTHEGATATIKALELGAFDFVAKPLGSRTTELLRVQESLLSSLREATAVKKEEVVERLQPPPLTLPPLRPQANPSPPSLPKLPLPPPRVKPIQADAGMPKNKAADKTKLPLARKKPVRSTNRLVAVGTSTGGPRALQQVLTKLPADFPAPVLVVQHMPPGFTRSLAQRLNSLCSIEVTEAEDGMEPMPGNAYIAPGGLHMVLRKEAGKYRLRLTSEPPRSGHRPSVDELFESLAAFPELDRTVVLMTGMGNDGAKGMKLLYDQGVKRTIAEDQSSCIVYGMPRAAVELGCVTKKVPLDAIAAQITEAVTQPEEV
jgi:two-component system chemotaxis response regulator CheB